MTKPRPLARLMRYHLRHTLARYPALYLPIARRRRHPDGFSRAVRPNTEIVIEGFPRSANTFAFAAFRQAQQRPVEVGHHLHLAAQVLYALRHDIPALVLIREPEPAILSYMILPSYPSPSPRHALKEYIRFYETLWPHRDRFVLGPFEEVTRDFGAILHRVNERYATRFQTFQHTPENVEACFAVAESFSRRTHGHVSSEDVARPEPKRAEVKKALRGRLHQPEFDPLLKRAQAIYQAFTDHEKNKTSPPRGAGAGRGGSAAAVLAARQL